jgi:hypothetical protein
MKRFYVIIGILAALCGIAQATPTVSGQNYASLVPAYGGYSDAFEIGYGYKWGINLANGVQLASAVVTVNTTLVNDPSGSYLYIGLIDAAPVTGVQQTSTAYTGDGYLTHLTGFVTDQGTFFNNNQNQTVQFSITGSYLTTLNSYLAAHSTAEGFNIGFEPNCTYIVSSMSITYSTRSVPDTAATVLLLGAGLLGLEIFRRKFALA